jgi:hypothetical protein
MIFETGAKFINPLFSDLWIPQPEMDSSQPPSGLVTPSSHPPLSDGPNHTGKISEFRMTIFIYKKGIKFPPPACLKDRYYEILSLLLSVSGMVVEESGHEFVHLLRSPGIDSQPGGFGSLESMPGLLKRLSLSCKKNSSNLQYFLLIYRMNIRNFTRK